MPAHKTDTAMHLDEVVSVQHLAPQGNNDAAAQLPLHSKGGQDSAQLTAGEARHLQQASRHSSTQRWERPAHAQSYSLAEAVGGGGTQFHKAISALQAA